jgi:hypothetical protein
MKPQNSGPRGTGAGRGAGRPAMRIPHLPIEWMDPMSWRLPSGKALAEFALQAGFLAPLMIGSPAIKRKKAASVDVTIKNAEEAQERSATFRETR